MDTILDDHAVGALDAAEKSCVARHLARCRRCADAWLIYEALAGEMPAAPHSDLYRNTLAAVVDRPATKPVPRWHRRLAPGLGLAAAAAMVLVVFAARRATDDEAPIPTREGPAVAGTRAPAESVLGDTPLFEPAIPGLIAGIHYERLPVAASTAAGFGRIEVIEFFMFGCPHCFAFEPALAAWIDGHAGEVELVRVPALFNETARLHARAFYTAEALDRIDALIGPFYDEIHLRGNPLASEDAIREFFGRHGVDARAFDDAFGSDAVQARLLRAAELNRLYRVSATPSIGVNGKYRTSGSMSGSNEAMLDVVDALIEFETGFGRPCPERNSLCPIPAPAPMRR